MRVLDDLGIVLSLIFDEAPGTRLSPGTVPKVADTELVPLAVA